LGQIYTTLKEAPFKVLPVKEIAKPIEGIINLKTIFYIKNHPNLSVFSLKITKLGANF
jgi:hypothetical protein